MSHVVDTIRKGPAEPVGAAPDASRSPRGGDTGAPELGVVSYFQIHDHATVERVIDGVGKLGVTHLRTAVSWADWESDGGPEWYEWLLPKLTAEFTVLPCVLYTPPKRGILNKSSSPPREPRAYGEFVEHLLTTYPDVFDHVELWNEPNNFIEWDWTVDPEWTIFAEMIGDAAARAARLGVKPVLGGMSPLDPNWLDLMFKRGAMNDMAVVGIHGFPGTWEAVWEGWGATTARVQEVLDKHQSAAEIWITECGFSTWAHDEYRMLLELVDVSYAPVPRAYWYSAEDLDPARNTLDGFHADERAYHFGLYRRNGTPKLPARVWAEGGLEAVRELADIGETRRVVSDRPRATLITGGAGFVGTNLADRLASEGKPVVVLDALARPGVEHNLRWLKAKHGDLINAHIGDVRDPFAVERGLAGCDEVFHLAAQVAVTTSLFDPRLDFDVNLKGTMNVLEAVRDLSQPVPVLFASTNKVYGALEDVELRELDDRYEPVDESIRTDGISEARPLEFCSPYGCSKGGADQYVLDYVKSFGVPATVFRMSCIYGPHQFGTEDQGWVAHFLIQAMNGEPITIYGDGKQVRDLLYVGDLVDAMVSAARRPELAGRAFNIGGGPRNSISVRGVLELIRDLEGSIPDTTFSAWRTADQRYYVSDTSRFELASGWAPSVGIREGLGRLHDWLLEETRRSGSFRSREPVSR